MKPSNLFDSLGFVPRRSNHYASWLPIYIEPMIASGERLCIGVVVADKEQNLVCAVPNLERLTCIFGREADALLLAAKLSLDTIQSRVNKYGITSLSEWQRPIEGLFFGQVQIGAGENLLDVARTALMQCASLIVNLPEADESTDTVTRTEGSLSRLESLVRDSVIALRPDLKKCFSATFQVYQNARVTKIGFAGTKLAANFGMLFPGKLAPLVNMLAPTEN